MKCQVITLLGFLLPVFMHAQEIVNPPIPEDQIVYRCRPCGCEDDDHYFDSMGDCPSCDMTLLPTIPGVESKIPANRSLTAAILLFDHADIMDVTGPWSVLVHNGVRVVPFAKTKSPVIVGMSMELTPDYTIDNLPDVDIIVFPGGGLAESNPGDEQIKKFIQSRSKSTEVLFSVCSGAFFLAEAGVLDGKTATTFASLIPQLRSNYPEINVVNNVKYTDNGQIVTTAGLSSGIDGTFHVISKFRGQGSVQDVANHMEYVWSKSSDYARSQLADRYIEGIRNVVRLVSKEYQYSAGDRNSWEYRYVLSGDTSNDGVISLLEAELTNTGRWKKHSSDSTSLSGVFTHDELGAGNVDIKIKSETNEDVIVIKASRAERYQSFNSSK